MFGTAAGRGSISLLIIVKALYEVIFWRVIEIMDRRYQVEGVRLE